METESESIDISSIKRAALASVNVSKRWSSHGSGLAKDTYAVQNARHMTRSQQPSGITRSRSDVAVDTERQHDSMPQLPSEVPETVEPVQHGSLSALPSQAGAVQQLHKMSGEGVSADATQELSPTYFNLLISKSRSAALPADLGQRVSEDETQQTLNEGDDGHVDLTSSFVPDQHQEEGHESDPIDFSPTQSQQHFSQFPESQRFKTPATVGKKRRYTGEFIDSPDLPRNPLLRSDAPTPHQVLGLSQAFAATQAGSSPFANGPILNPQSDRPSPNIDLQARPATASTSSPLRPISELRRATTEPASRYIPVKQSQAERQKRNLQPIDERNGEVSEDDDDDFSEEPSIIRQERALRDRKQKMKAQYGVILSPTKRTPRGRYGVRSSPIPSPPIPSPELLPARPSSSDIQHDPDDHNKHVYMPMDLHDSEVETEQEDEEDVVQQRSSQLTSMDEEDKENCEEPAIQIPQTTARLRRIMNDFPRNVEASPSLRHGCNLDLQNNEAGLESSEPFAIANSQPSQPLGRDQHQEKSKSDNATHDIEIILQSQQEFEPHDSTSWLTNQPASITDEKGKTTGERSTESGPVRPNTQTITGPAVLGSSTSARERESAPAHLESTVPETSSGEHVDNSRRINSQAATLDTTKTTTSGPSNFETAPTHLPPPENSHHTNAEMSSPPILTTPPGRKRKRMSEIAAQESPQQSSLGFDAAAALHLEPDFQNLSSQSPIRAGIRQSKRVRLSQIQEITLPQIASERRSPVGDQIDAQPTPDTPQDDADMDAMANSGKSQEQSSSPTFEKSMHLTGLRSARRDPASRVRSSGWDIGASPPQKNVPKAKSPVILLEGSGFKLSTKVSGVIPRPKTANISRRVSKQPFLDPRSSPDPIALMSDPIIDKSTEKFTDVETGVVAPSMVFACFNGKTRAYYPARCLGSVEGNASRYRIQWEGYDPDEVDIYGIRSLDIRVGDLVKIDLNGFAKISYVVRGFKDKEDMVEDGRNITDIRGYKTLLVAPRQRKSLPAKLSTETVKEVPVSAIYLDNNMWQQMKDRKFEFLSQSVLSRSLSGYATPNERQVTPTTPSSRTRKQTLAVDPLPMSTTSTGIFTNMVFAISYEDNDRKRTISNLVQTNGGLMLEDSFVDMLEQDQIIPSTQFTKSGFTALIADRYSRKEKYMQALALNLPCISGRWIEMCVKNNTISDWQDYLLPAGESDELEGAAKSRIMSRIDAASVQFVDMLELRPKILQDMNIVVVMGRGKAELKRKPYLFLIQALGPSKIEKVPDLKAAKALSDAEQVFDYVFLEDREVESAKTIFTGKNKKHKGCKVGGNHLIVQSLIMGRLCDS